jgi:hypothetical protein
VPNKHVPRRIADKKPPIAVRATVKLSSRHIRNCSITSGSIGACPNLVNGDTEPVLSDLATWAIVRRACLPHDIASGPDLVLRHPAGGPVATASARHGEDRAPRLGRALRGLCRIGGDRRGRLRRNPRRHADHRRLLGIRRRSGVPPALLPRSASSDRGFRSVGVWGVVRRPCCGSVPAAAVGLARLGVVGFNGRSISTAGNGDARLPITPCRTGSPRQSAAKPTRVASARNGASLRFPVRRAGSRVATAPRSRRSSGIVSPRWPRYRERQYTPHSGSTISSVLRPRGRHSDASAAGSVCSRVGRRQELSKAKKIASITPMPRA